MNNRTFLSDAKIKEFTNNLEAKLPMKTRIALIKIKNKYGIELYWDRNNNLYNFQNFIISRMKEKQVYFPDRIGLTESIQKFISENYNDEYAVVRAFDGEPVWQYMYDFCDKNKVERLNWVQLVECSNIGKFINDKYNKKNVNQDSLKTVAELVKIIEKFYKDLPDEQQRGTLVFAFNDYLVNGDEQMLFNTLNYIQK